MMSQIEGTRQLMNRVYEELKSKEGIGDNGLVAEG
jgi:hypothetical protein